MAEIKNAKIVKTMLGREDHGIMTWMIFIEFYPCTCGVGGYALDQYDRATETRICHPYGSDSIQKVLDVVGVDTWEQLPGKYIRFKDEGWGSIVTEIGHIIEDKWFNMKEYFKEWSNKTYAEELHISD